MNGAAQPRWKWVAGAIAIVAYAVAVDHANSHPGSRTFGAVLAVAPLVAIGADAVRRWRSPVLSAFCAVIAAVAVYVSWSSIEAHFDRLLFAQQSITYLALGLLFAASLLPGRTPLCTRIGAMLQGPLDEPTQRYTRGVTYAWALMLLAIAATLTVLYVTGQPRAWSLFSNYGPLILLPAAFVIEWVVRRRRLPGSPKLTLTSIVEAWQRRDARP